MAGVPMSDIINRDELEREMSRKLGRLFKEQRDKLIEALGYPPDIANVPADFWQQSGVEFTQTVRPILMNLYMQQAQVAMASSNIGVDWTLANENAARWANNYAFDLVKGINARTMSILQTGISSYFRDSWTRGELENFIGQAYSPVRAEMIAVTEITRAAVQGERSVYQEIEKSGVRMVEIWQTNKDEKVCKICGPRQGKKLGDGWSDPPPAHPRCRCWTNHKFEGA